MAALSPFTGEPEQYGDRTSAELSPVRPSPERDIPLAKMAPLLPAPGAPGTQLAPLISQGRAPDVPVERGPEPPDLVAATRQASQDYETIGRAKSAVNAALINADVGIANEPDPKKRAKLIADRQQLGQTQALAAQSQQAAGEAVEMNIAKAGEELAVKQADETLSAMEEADAAITEGQAKRDRRLAEQASTLEKAKRDQEESRARYTATLERGPRAAAVGSTFADIISETFSAALEQRVPNYAAVTKAAWDRDRALFQEDVSRAAGAMATSGDRVRDMGAETDNIIAEESTAQAAVIDAVTRKAELAVQRARTPLEKAKAGAVYKGMQEQRDAARANAAQARIDAQRKADKHLLDMQLGAAKIGKLGADTAKAEAAAAKLGRRGGGKGRAPAGTSAGLIGPTQVAFPGSATDEIALTIGDPKKPTSIDRKKTEKLRTVLTYNSQLLSLANKIEAAIEDADAKGVMGTAGWNRSAEWVELESQIANLIPEISKIGSGGFAATDNDAKWAKENLPSTPTLWDTKAKSLAKARALKRRIQDRARFALSAEGVKAQLAETIIGKQVKYSTSRRDMAEKAVADAPATLVDTTKEAPARIAAIDAIEETARSEAGGDDWLGLAVGRISSALPKIDDNEVRKVAFDRLGKWKRFAEARLRKKTRGGDFSSDPKEREKAIQQLEDLGGDWVGAAKRLRDDFRVVDQIDDARRKLGVVLREEVKGAVTKAFR